MSQPRGQQPDHAAGVDDGEDFAAVIQGLTHALQPVEPRQAFTDGLRRDLLELDGGGMLSRWRGMPASVQIAAALALLAGFGLLLTRRLFGSDEAETIVEEGVAAAH